MKDIAHTPYLSSMVYDLSWKRDIDWTTVQCLVTSWNLNLLVHFQTNSYNALLGCHMALWLYQNGNTCPCMHASPNFAHILKHKQFSVCILGIKIPRKTTKQHKILCNMENGYLQVILTSIKRQTYIMSNRWLLA
jgi:hypothetical protein